MCAAEDVYLKGGVCIDCPSAAGSVTASVIVFVLVMLVASALFLFHEVESPRWDTVGVPFRQWVHFGREHASRFGVMAKLKLALSFCQVIAALDRRTAVLRLVLSWHAHSNPCPGSCAAGPTPSFIPPLAGCTTPSSIGNTL